MTNVLLEYYVTLRKNIIDLTHSIQEELSEEKLYSMFRNLKCFKAYFNLLKAIDADLLPGQETLITYDHFYRTTEELENLSRQNKQIDKYESDIGIDLSFLKSYITELYQSGHQAFMDHVQRFDLKNLDIYKAKLEEMLPHESNPERLRNIITYTENLIKKVEKILEKKSTARRFHKLKNYIEEIFVLFDIINQDQELENVLYSKLIKRSSYLYEWYNRVISYEIIKKYRKDHPVKAESSYGSLEIVKDYLVKKIFMNTRVITDKL